MTAKRCFLCHKKMDEKTGLCTNPKCVRSKPIISEKSDSDNETKEETKE